MLEKAKENKKLERSEEPWKIDKIMEAIHGLSMSQGFYGRLERNILEAKEENPETYEAWKNDVEAQEFHDVLDMVMYFEC